MKEALKSTSTRALADALARIPARAPAGGGHPRTLAEQHSANVAAFARALGAQRLWYLLPAGQSSVEQASGVYERQSGLIYPSATALRAFLDQHPFVYVQTPNGKTLATLHSQTKLLWNNETSTNLYSLAEAKQLVQQGRWAGLAGWCLPTYDTLRQFATDGANPHRKGGEYRLADADGVDRYKWIATSGRVDTHKGCWGVEASSSGSIFACDDHWAEASDQQIWADLFTLRNWRLVAPSGVAFGPDARWQGLPDEELLQACIAEGLQLRAHAQADLTLDPSQFTVWHQWAVIDYRPCRLPKLDHAQLSDPEKGLWELWGEDAAALKRFGFTARDPQRDLQGRAVAIDFGTSSTVVAMDTTSGGRELLRIGVRDYYQAVQAQQFENPTVLECLDYAAFYAAWSASAYRPALDWDWMCAAHEAQASFRDNPGDTRVLASILPRLKQWALRSGSRRLRLTDRQGLEIELAAHTERNPVRGQALEAAAEQPFDPIELYAWYLGMAINWRGRGLFYKYYLTFPIKYPREVKNCVLASFRRGLQRSLPPSLIAQHPQVLNDFRVEELASEPAAYAAAALPQLKLDPTERGLPYAVFDFGGGTTDFDFGLLRTPTPEEHDQGITRVFEHLASSGDNFLGGENLLEHLVYAAFQHNLALLREKRIQFTQPLDAQPFDGSEAFLAPTQAAQTNTVLLAAKLRPFLESATPELERPAPALDTPTPAPVLERQFKLDLIDANGNKQTCELVLDTQALDQLLAERIRRGVQAFLAELAQLRDALPAGAPIHVLLAGNGSRSRHITALFDADGEHWPQLLAAAYGTQAEPPSIVVHAPLPIDEKSAHAPTAKTGVALGLLRLRPGKGVLLLDHLKARNDGQAPFAWYVGRMHDERFEPILPPGCAYQQWHELGALQQGAFDLYATTSPRAQQGLGEGLSEGHPELKLHALDFHAAPARAKLYARAVAPHLLELATAHDSTEIDGTTVLKLALQ